MKRIVVVTAAPARDVDEDLPLLVSGLSGHELGPTVVVADWDDLDLDWAAQDLVVIRSPWDYTSRLEKFHAWLTEVGAAVRVVNDPELVRWNTDKRYLVDLAAAGVPVVPATFVPPGEALVLPDELEVSTNGPAEVVVKPSVGAGSRDAARHRRDDIPGIEAHVAHLHAKESVAMIQPHVPSVDAVGEAALVHFGGRFSHAITKGPLLERGAEPHRALFAPERIARRTPGDNEVGAAAAVLDALADVPALAGVEMPAYARVDLVEGPDETPMLLELEVCEPSLFLATAPASIDRYVEALLNASG